MFKREYWDLTALNQKKQKYKAEMNRVNQLPQDYQQVFKQISDYLMGNYGGFDGFDLMDAQVKLVDFFSEAADHQTPISELIGPDAMEFAHSWGNSLEVPNWLDKYQAKKQAKVNHRVHKQLGGK